MKTLAVSPLERNLCFFVLTVVALAVGCGDQIGDSCSISTDCTNAGDRYCDPSSPGGYCTIAGCDYDTCPNEAVCVRFFSTATSDRPCDSATEDISTDDCTIDEICTLAGHCVSRNAETRFCMLTCGSSGDCRTEYECRDEDLMKLHGGQPVIDPDATVTDEPQAFCAPAPLSS